MENISLRKKLPLEEYLTLKEDRKDEKVDFESLCKIVETEFNKDFQSSEAVFKEEKIFLEKKAIMGGLEERSFYVDKIRDIIRSKNLGDVIYPKAFRNLEEGVFAQVYGLSYIDPWAYDLFERYGESPSAKIIGGRVYFLINGKMELQEETIPLERREKLKRALLLATPRERLDKGFHEVYLANGIRITIFSGHRTKPGEEIFVFRKYVVKKRSFENLASLKTIDQASIKLFENMVKIGFNVVFAGKVRSGKTTFLQIWQSYEDSNLEGVTIATDPETNWQKIMEHAPLMQLIGDGAELELIKKSLLRGDNDYFLLEEMRDGQSFSFLLDVLESGTLRTKSTIHSGNPIEIPYKIAKKASQYTGEDWKNLVAQVYKNIDFIFYLVPCSNNTKVLSKIIQLSYSYNEDQIYTKTICEYDFKNEIWMWSEEFLMDNFYRFKREGFLVELLLDNLKKLHHNNPLDSEVISPAYYRKD